MPDERPEYLEKMRTDTRQSVWLVIEVPGIEASKVDGLKEELTYFAVKWTGDAQESADKFGQRYSYDVGITDTEKLQILERIK